MWPVIVVLSLFTLSHVSAKETGKYDVCVIGGGAYGMSSAVFAKDRGYSVLILDSANQVGGHCDTYKQTVPVPPGMPDWLELGVSYFPDTIQANKFFDGIPNGRWKIDTASFFRRFVGDQGIQYIDFTADSFHTPNYLADSATGFTAGPFYMSQNKSAEFIQAYQKLYYIVTVQYPMMDTGFWEGPVPSELLIPFSEYMNLNGLQPLLQLFRPILFQGGLGQFKNLTAFYALRNLGPTINHIFDTPNAAFGVIGGCQRFYDGMVSYLGTQHVKVNATVTSIRRPKAHETSYDSHPIHIQGTLTNWGRKHRRNCVYEPPTSIRHIPFSYKCGRIVLGLPQLPSNHHLIGLDVDSTERALWASMTARGYYDGLVDVTGGVSNITINPTYQIQQFNPLNPPIFDPFYPSGWVGFGRLVPIPGSPAVFYAYASDGPLPEDQVRNITQIQLDALPHTLIDRATIVDIGLHVFQAHPSNQDLARPDGWFNAVRAIQGRRNTIWGGASVNFPAHHILINDAFVTIDRLLPPKH